MLIRKCMIYHNNQMQNAHAPCPVEKDSSINPRNFMPTYSQKPIAQQKGALPTNRTISTIPKADDDASAQENKLWEYPSPQQFFNAVMKKGFTNTQEEDVPAMVSIHNAVNERAWQEILEWERSSGAEKCGGVKLVQFRGDSKILTPKARMLSFFGYTRPFDTHFWTIDRCGTKVDYVIDFYKGKQAESSDPRKLLMPSFYLDVRPHGIEGFPARLRRVVGF
ncbi:Putative cytochrome c1 heme lyase [Taphrina deformans PYCC 5710]|uniref:Holocytochrome c-type synthase n=1 Tax=Taphrina deformans (strain PYCC 5710 / ATCC 11124 / CBS 356.35 / IMI 108563 / JCM 9778 / NBRC 8474) TaxID=1097556 RepID=R4XBN9_TAPDE|nr:Putative cytochrome c1 heme lyase [Taphrina deformans PYCC 5710]|eukprot:CCG83280.1 Putative cytochrome c1 heme lyase [Taphrina deformans PYCC 5710]